MPTPFMHLEIAEELRDRAGSAGPTAALLGTAWPAFYFGSVAPDCQSVAGLPREQTHFYGTATMPAPGAFADVLAQFPTLRYQPDMPADHAAFVVAYCAHLLFDVLWFRRIVVPFFGEPDFWTTHQERFLAHNSLLIYLDRLAFNTLPTDAGAVLRAATPRAWLPFVPDAALVRWRDEVADQLRPGSHARTIEVYARRLRLAPEDYAANLSSPQWMEETVFSKVPLQAVQGILDEGRAASLEVIDRYLAGRDIVPERLSVPSPADAR